MDHVGVLTLPHSKVSKGLGLGAPSLLLAWHCLSSFCAWLQNGWQSAQKAIDGRSAQKKCKK